jgi:hypothetical protein
MVRLHWITVLRRLRRRNMTTLRRLGCRHMSALRRLRFYSGPSCGYGGLSEKLAIPRKQSQRDNRETCEPVFHYPLLLADKKSPPDSLTILNAWRAT